MKLFDTFFIRVVVAAIMVLLFHQINFEGILQSLEVIYINLARTLDPGYSLTIFAQNSLIWIAGISALWFFYR